MTEHREEKGGPTFIHRTAEAIEAAEDRKQARALAEQEEREKKPQTPTVTYSEEEIEELFRVKKGERKDING